MVSLALMVAGLHESPWPKCRQGASQLRMLSCCLGQVETGDLVSHGKKVTCWEGILLLQNPDGEMGTWGKCDLPTQTLLPCDSSHCQAP